MSPPHKLTKGIKSVVNTNDHGYNGMPKGFTWSDNSCAYDSALTILFSVWTSDNPRHEVFLDMTSNLAKTLQLPFQNITNDEEFEKHRDIFRYELETIDPRCHTFGEFASIGSLLHHLLATEHETTRYHNRCLNNHTEAVHSVYSGHFIGTEVHGSIQQWINLPSLYTRRRCRVCNNSFTQFVDYIDLPQIIAFELKDRSTAFGSIVSVTQLSGTVLNYRLAGIIYFGDLHFVARIIRQDGQIWFHDGITTHRNLIYEGSIGSGRIDLSLAHSKNAHTGIYCRI